ncbi:MAG TPA: MoaD/ThiS family protein [Pantanalinema sp.]
MRFKIRLFAMLREAQGAEHVALDLEEGATIGAVRRAIAEGFPALAVHLPSARFSASCRFVGDDHVPAEGEELALIPPVSGG